MTKTSSSNKLFSKANMIPWIVIFAGLAVAFSRPIYSMVSPAKLDIKITEAPVVMPSIYKVYANEEALEGKYSLFKMILTNNSSHSANNVEVAFDIPGIVEKKVFEKIPKVLPGQTVVVNCYPSLPSSIVERTTASKEAVNITVKGSNIKEVENSFDVQFKGRNDFVYSFIPAEEIRTAAESFDNKELLSCLVTPEDPIIKYLTQQIQEKILKGETAAVTNQEAESLRFMLGVYEATLRSHMVYSGTSGVPEKIGDLSTLTQSIRLPREVITGKTGLCIELSLLYASVMMCAGMDPLVYLVPGHAYPGFRVGGINGKYYAIESTGIGGEGIGGRSSGEEALKVGMKNLETFMQHAYAGDPAYMILDVREAIKQGAIAMELKDDNFFRQKIDEIAKTFTSGAVPSNVNAGIAVDQSGSGGDTNGGGGGGNTGGGNVPNGYTAYNGAVSFAYPSSWRTQPKTQYTMPQCIKVLSNPSNSQYVEIYSFPGLNNGEQAIQSVQQYVHNVGAQMGMQLQYERAGESDGFSVFRGITGNQNIQINWVAAFKRTGNGVAGIAVGSKAGVNTQATTTNILNTLR